MIYVLQQRLKAQKVSGEKQKKVLEDVIETMYNESFIEELMKPQAVYSRDGMQKIFQRLAHSSIMRLNTSSMEKLYDLMAMGFKHQILLCHHAAQLAAVTRIHLSAVKAAVAGTAAAALVEAASRDFEALCSTMTLSSWHLLRQALCAFFHGHTVKVSLFLTSGLQEPAGVFRLANFGALPMSTERPGEILYYEAGQVARRSAFDATRTRDATCPRGLDAPLGTNIYDREATTGPRGPIPRSEDAQAKAAAPDLASRRELAERLPTGGRLVHKSATEDLNLLAQLIGAEERGDARAFQLNLFAEDPFDGPSGAAKLGGANVAAIDAAKAHKSVHDMVADMKLDDVISAVHVSENKGSKFGVDDDDDENDDGDGDDGVDLLALMDSAK